MISNPTSDLFDKTDSKIIVVYYFRTTERTEYYWLLLLIVNAFIPKCPMMMCWHLGTSWFCFVYFHRYYIIAIWASDPSTTPWGIFWNHLLLWAQDKVLDLRFSHLLQWTLLTCLNWRSSKSYTTVGIRETHEIWSNMGEPVGRMLAGSASHWWMDRDQRDEISLLFKSRDI